MFFGEYCRGVLITKTNSTSPCSLVSIVEAYCHVLW